MKVFIIGYLIVINLSGFALMGIDKWKAKNNRWRIRERTLFLIAILGGSIGSLAGMYLFRHKTRHLAFTIGIPAILVLELLLAVLLFLNHQERLGSPSAAVEQELSLIQELDEATIQNFISYENLANASAVESQVGPETAEAVQLFFKNFTYHIHSEEISGDTALVSAEIINIDTQALARDLCLSLTASNIHAASDSPVLFTMSDYFLLLRDTLQQKRYDLTASTAYFHLTKENNIWTIQADDTLEDQLVSGFITWMNDASLLKPEEVLTIYLDDFASLTAAQWMTYLDVYDIFATYSESYYQQIDQAYMEKIADYFAYTIDDCTIDGNTASASVTITSVDMNTVLSDYKKRLLQYAHTTESIRENDQQVADASAGYLLDAFQSASAPASFQVTATLFNDGSFWQLDVNDALTNAFLGDIHGAIESFTQS